MNETLPPRKEALIAILRNRLSEAVQAGKGGQAKAFAELVDLAEQSPWLDAHEGPFGKNETREQVIQGFLADFERASLRDGCG